MASSCSGGHEGGSESTGTQLDAALVYEPGRVTSTELFWGLPKTTSKAVINGTSTIPYSTSLCVSAGATGYRCNFERSSDTTLACITYSTTGDCVRTANIVGVSSTNGQIIFGGGDSGGAVYYISPSGARLVTSIVEGYKPGTAVVCGSINSVNEGAPCTIEKGRVTAMSSMLTALAGRDFVVRAD